jgi:hypothetical protein
MNDDETTRKINQLEKEKNDKVILSRVFRNKRKKETKGV